MCVHIHQHRLPINKPHKLLTLAWIYDIPLLAALCGALSSLTMWTCVGVVVVREGGRHIAGPDRHSRAYVCVRVCGMSVRLCAVCVLESVPHTLIDYRVQSRMQHLCAYFHNIIHMDIKRSRSGHVCLLAVWGRVFRHVHCSSAN